MKKFISFLVIWISQNLAMPFWIVGHIHLSTNVYQDLHEILASVGMNAIVLAGFIMDYINNTKIDRTTNTNEEDKGT
jgi:hypothetical protein